MVNEVRAGFNRNHYRDNIPAYGQNYPSSDLAVPGVPNNPTVNGLTLFQPSGFRRIGEPGYTPTFSTSQEFQYGDTLNIIHGKHSIKLGPQIRLSQFNLFQVGQPRGRFSFSGEFTADDPSSGDGTGVGLADMLLGDPSTAVISTLTYFGNRQKTYGAFVQDDYKLSSSLTLNLGLRYDYTTPITEAHNRQSNFDFATGQLVVAGQNGASDGLVTTDKADFSPRLGLAYSPFPSHKTVIRAGYGRFFSYQEIRTGDPLQLGYNLPFFFEPSFVSDGITPILTVSGGFPSLNLSQAKFAGVTSNDSRLHAPVTDEWNFNIQQQLPSNILVEVAYVGAKGHAFASSGGPQSGSNSRPRRRAITPALPGFWPLHVHRESWELQLPFVAVEGGEAALARLDVFERVHLQQVHQRSTRDLLQQSVAAEFLRPGI